MKTRQPRDASHAAAESTASTRQDSAPLFTDKRPQAIAQRQQQQLIAESPQTAQLQAKQQGIVQREGDDDEPDWDNIQGRERSNAVVRGRVDTSKIEGLLAAHGGRNPLDAAAVAATPKDGMASKIGRKVLGDSRSTAEKAQTMAAESARQNTDERARANQLGLFGRLAAKLPFIGGDKVRDAAAGQKAIAHENADAHKKINQSLALKGGGMAVSGAAAATSLIPVDPISQGLIKSAVKVGGSGLSYAGSAKEGQSGALLSEQAASRAHGLMTMNLDAEGRARTENAKVGKQQAKTDGVKALIPGSDMLGAVGVGDIAAKVAPTVLGKVADKALGPTDEQRAAVRGLQADAQINKERLNAVSIRGPSKHMSPEERAKAEQQKALMAATQATLRPKFLGGHGAAVDNLKPVEQRAAPEPVVAEESELERALRLRREKTG